MKPTISRDKLKVINHRKYKIFDEPIFCQTYNKDISNLSHEMYMKTIKILYKNS